MQVQRLEISTMRRIEPERIERAARIYASNVEASKALGIAPGSFSRLCRAYGIETPYARKRRRRYERRRSNALRQIPGEEFAAFECRALGLDPEEIRAAAQELEHVP